MFPSGASVNVWTFFNSCVWVPQLSSVWKHRSQNPTVTAGKGSNMQKCLKTDESAGAGGFFWRTELSLTAQDKQETHEQPSQNLKTVVDHQVTTHSIENQWFTYLWMGLF